MSQLLTNLIRIGNVEIGAGRPVAIQSMTTSDTRDAEATIGQLRALREAGCDIARVAIPDMEAARAFGGIRGSAGMPLVADIHFDYRLALECIRQGADKVRINPGNIGGRDRVKQVADTAKERGIPIRIGVNGGSLEKTLLEKYGGVTADALCESAVNQAEMLNMCGFYDIVVSIKSSDVFLTVDACRLFDEKRTGIPQHIGLTESGALIAGLVKSTIALYELLRRGIGDTLRVSLTGDHVEEVVAAKALLRALGRAAGVEIISCPTCGRCKVDMIPIVKDVERRILGIKTDRRIKAAIMGCAVNGPGEARDADVGAACGAGKALLFKRGEPLYQVPQEQIADALLREIESII